MSSPETDQLVRELSRNLEPVRPILRLRSMLALTLLAFAVAVLCDALLGHPLPLPAGGVAWRNPTFLAVLVGLLLTVVGGIPAALGGAVPGREVLARRARGVALLGAGIASVAGIWAVVRADLSASALPVSATLECGGRASALGLVPALLVCVFLARACARRPLLGAGLAAVGAAAMGAVVVHTSCTAGAALHVLLGHWVTPLAAGLLLALPLSLLVGRLSPRA